MTRIEQMVGMRDIYRADVSDEQLAAYLDVASSCVDDAVFGETVIRIMLTREFMPTLDEFALFFGKRRVLQ